MIQHGPEIFDLFLSAVFCILVAWGIRLLVKDAIRRGKSPWLVCLFVFFTFPASLLAWILFRPDPKDGSTPKAFRLEDHRVQ
jgi:hypothetical protein